MMLGLSGATKLRFRPIWYVLAVHRYKIFVMSVKKII